MNTNKIYKVLSNLKYNGTLFEKGSFVHEDLPMSLVEDGIVELVPGADTVAEAAEIDAENQAGLVAEQAEPEVKPENTWGPKDTKPEEKTGESQPIAPEADKPTDTAPVEPIVPAVGTGDVPPVKAEDTDTGDNL